MIIGTVSSIGWHYWGNDLGAWCPCIYVLERHAWHALVTAWKDDIFGKYAFGHFGGSFGWQWFVQSATKGTDVLIYWKLMKYNGLLQVWAFPGGYKRGPVF